MTRMTLRRLTGESPIPVLTMQVCLPSQFTRHLMETLDCVLGAAGSVHGFT